METSQPDVVVNRSARLPKGILLPIITLIIGVFIGVVAGRFLSSKPTEPTSQQPATPQISQNDSPIAFSLLQNSIITQWRAGVEGTLTAKTKDSITLSRNNNVLTIPLSVPPDSTPMTFFHNEELMKKGKNSRITLEQIPLGSYLRGDFFVVPDKEGYKNRIVGSSFTLTATPSAQSIKPSTNK